MDGDLTIVGIGRGHYEYKMNGLPFGVQMTNPYWGSKTELMEVIGLARQGKIHIQIEKHPLEEAVAVYDKLRKRQIKDRAVLVPYIPG